jgi:hypothetical protein
MIFTFVRDASIGTGYHSEVQPRLRSILRMESRAEKSQGVRN